ncbi:autotransporter domain-containing protein [Kosakonia sp.]|uniref:autotransporter family protein n=1 Tax=Kosakonia sp. TaxID=1916651 RepID=UPI00289F179C|nr:autotransporter domain-containing protein [Kosakonia sp.]
MTKSRLNQHGSLLVAITSAQGLLAPYAHAVPTSETISTAVTSGRVYTTGFDTLEITSQGTLTAASNTAALQIASSGNLASLANHGLLFATGNFGVVSTGTLGTLTNTGMINAPGFSGIYLDLGSATSAIINSGTIGNTSSNSYVGSGITTAGVLGTLTNTASGVISGRTGVYNRGTLTLLNNAGTITNQNNLGVSDLGAIFNNAGTITTLVNTGTVIYDHTGTNQTGGAAVRNLGVIGELTNAGTILSDTFGIRSDDFMSTIGTITNSGLIQAPQAISLENYFAASEPTLINSGTIAGDIANLTNLPFTITGGTVTTGTLTGYANSIGTLQTNGNALTFASGSLLLNDNITSHNATILNDAAQLRVVNPITITGNYHQNAAATLLLGVADGTSAAGSTQSDYGYGRLIINGTATLDQGSHISLARTGNTYQFAPGQRYVVIDASSTGTNYNASTLNYNAAGYTGAVSGTTVNDGSRSALVVSLARTEPDVTTRPTPGTVTPPERGRATRPGAAAALGGLGNYAGISPQLLELYNASLAITHTQEANRVGEGLSSSQNINASAATATAINKAMTVVATHMNSVRNPHTAGASGVATGDDYSSNWILWGQPFGGFAHQGTTDSVSGYHAKFGGILLGADRALGSRWRAGAAVNISNTSVHGQDSLKGSTSTADNYGVIGYAAYSGEPWYLNLSAGLNRQNYHSRRQVDFTGFSGTAQSTFNGQSVTLQSEAGYPFTLPHEVVLTPLASFTYGYQHIEGYQETGGNGMALNVGSTHGKSLQSDIGLRVEKSVATRLGNLTPFAQITWLHQYGNRQMSSTANYAADTVGETQFTTKGASPVKDMAGVAIGSTLYEANDMSLDARYDLQAGQQYQAHTFSLRLRKTF